MDKKFSRQTLIVGISAFATGILLMALLSGLFSSKDVHVSARAETEKGPHNGKLFHEGDLTVELQIFEKGVPPEFRLYVYKDEKQLPVSNVKATVTLKRLATQPEVIAFEPHGEYLLGQQEIYEPHSFEGDIAVTIEGKTYKWHYSQFEGRTELTSEAIIASGIKTERVRDQIIENTLQVFGEIVPDENKVVRLMPLARGYIAELKVNTGDYVRRGQLLAVIQSRELAEIKGEYLAAVKRNDLATSEFKRSEELWKKQVISEKEFFAAQYERSEAGVQLAKTRYRLLALGFSSSEIQSLSSQREQHLARYELRSPISGRVLKKNIAVGNAVTSDEAMNSPLFIIADVSSVWAMMTIPMKDLQRLAAGQTIEVSTNDGVTPVVRAKIIYIDNVIDEATRTAKARVELPNGNGWWKPGMFVKGKVVLGEVHAPLAVRTIALQTFRDWNVVFIREKNTFEIRPLELGAQDSMWTEVISGIRKGDEYVTEESYLLKADVEKSGASHDH